MKLFKYLFFILLLPLSLSLEAQLPYYGDGLIYRIGSGASVISMHDPNLPASATNPANNNASLSINFSASGLAIGKNMALNDGTYTFYVCNGNTNTYFYYDLASNSWLNTNHSFGSTAAVNPGMGGGLMYNLVGGSGQIWKYDFTGPATLLTTITDFGGGGPYDLVVDCLGNFYVLKCSMSGSGQWLRKYDPNGVLDFEWDLVGAPNSSAGGGFAIVGDTMYYHNNSSFVTAIIGTTTVDVINIQTGIGSASDYANIPIGAGPMEGLVDSVFVCEAGTIQYTPTTTEQVEWGITSGNPTNITYNNGDLSIDYTGSFELFIEGFSACAEGNIVTDTLRLFLVDADIQMADTVKINGCGSFTSQLNAQISTNYAFLPHEISWSSPVGQVTSGAGTNNPSIEVNQSGYFYLEVTIPAPYGDCTYLDSVYIEATDYTIYPSFTYDLEPSCNFSTITVNNTSTYGNPNANHSGQWDFGNNNTSSQLPTASNVYDETGFFYVTLDLSNQYCEASHTEAVPVTFPRTDTVSFREVVCTSDMPYDFFGEEFDSYGHFVSILTNQDGCDSVVHLTLIEGQEYVNSYVKTICPGETYVFGNRILKKNGVYTDQFVSKHGCDSIVEVTLKVEDFIMDLQAYPNPAYEGELVTLQAHGNYDFDIDAWDPSHLFIRPRQNVQKLTFDEAGVYNIEVFGTSENGCNGQDDVNIEVLPIDPTVFLPNAFSPNNDGLNDEFGPQLLIERGYSIDNFSIYNRYGQLVFHSKGTQAKGWDGHFNGQPSPMDTYMYVIEVRFTNGEAFEIKGDVHLIR